MTSTTTTPSFSLVPGLEMAWQDVDRSFARFCPRGPCPCNEGTISPFSEGTNSAFALRKSGAAYVSVGSSAPEAPRPSRRPMSASLW
jgi:hypothetical protein